MSPTELILNILTVLSIPSLAGMLFQARRRNKKLTAETNKIDAQGVQVITDTAIHLMENVNKQLRETEKASADLKLQLASTTKELAAAQTQVEELTKELEHQRLAVNETTVKLEDANKLADLYRRRYEESERKRNA